MDRRWIDTRTDEALSNALSRVKQALRKNTDIFLMHDLPLFGGTVASAKPELEKALGTTTMGQSLASNKKSTKGKAEVRETLDGIKNKKRRSLVKTVLKDKNRLVKRIKIGGMNLVCSLSRLGPDAPESFVEGGVVFINRDHPLFSQTARDDAVSGYHLARLITQELVKLANPEKLEQAYDWQSRLLTDALVEKNPSKQS